MKRILVMLLVLTAALSSCKKDQLTDTTVADPTSNTALPLKAVTYIADNYPDAAIDYYVAVTNGSADYLVTLNTREELAFNKGGDFLGRGENFMGGHHGDSTSCHPGGGGIPIDSLPAAIPAYVSANYSGYSIRHADYDSLCLEGIVIRVMLFQAGFEPVKLYFDLPGNFLMRSDRSLYTDLPQVVRDFIAASYAGFQAAPRAEKLTLANAEIQYCVFLHQNDVKKSVRVDALGGYICEQSGFHHGGHGHPGSGGGGHPGPGGIPPDSLPSAVTSYISVNYAGYMIRHAHYDSICVTGLAIRVDIDKPGEKPVSLFFDLPGTFVMKSDRIRFFDLPLSVKDYIAANYAGYHPGETELLTMADGTLQYHVDLLKPHQMKRITFDAGGVVICEL